MKIGINGICGRMGQAIAGLADERSHVIGAAFDTPASKYFSRSICDFLNIGDSDVTVEQVHETGLQQVDGLIDFTTPEATMTLLELAVKAKTPVVIGTTGFSKQQIMDIHRSAESIAVLFSPNMSIGVNMLFKLIELASVSLQNGFDVEIFEAHHKFKKDAPSGTAKKMLEIIKNNNTQLSDADETCSRNGIIGERTDNEIGVMAMRGGDIVGEHTVYFIGMGERIEITHRATNRDNFAKGAIVGMEYLADKTPGLYSMYDVLGL